MHSPRKGSGVVPVWGVVFASQGIVLHVAYSRAMPRDEFANAESTRAELAALANTLDQCRQRLGDLAVTRAMAVHNPDEPHAGDNLLTTIYEAERGVNTALRLVQRAARSR